MSSRESIATPRKRVIAVEAVGRWEIVFDDQAVEALLEHVVGAGGPVFAGSKAGDLRHGPQATPITIWIGAAGIRKLARKADIAIEIKVDRFEVARGVEPIHIPLERLRAKLFFSFGGAL